MNLQASKSSYTPVQANDVDAQLEHSLTHEWDAQIMTYPNEKYPFNEWLLNRIRMMGYPVEDLSYLHKVVPQPETFKVTKQLCADTNLPEFRRMLLESRLWRFADRSGRLH